MIYSPRTTVTLISTERIWFDPDEGIFNAYPTVARRFARLGVEGGVTSLVLSYNGDLFDDIYLTYWEVGRLILSDELDFYLCEQQCRHVRRGHRNQPKLGITDLLDRPTRTSRLKRFSHMISHAGFNPLIGCAELADVSVPLMTQEATISVPNNRFNPNAFRVFYGFDAGPMFAQGATKIAMLAQVCIAVLEGDPVACGLERWYWQVLMQEPQEPLILSDYPWSYFTGFKAPMSDSNR